MTWRTQHISDQSSDELLHVHGVWAVSMVLRSLQQVDEQSIVHDGLRHKLPADRVA